MEIAQVLYDVQFVAYLKKTFLEDLNQMAKATAMNQGGVLHAPGMLLPQPLQHQQMQL